MKLRRRGRRLRCGTVACFALAAAVTLAQAGTLEVIGRAKTNNRIDVVTFRIDPASSFASELRVRSGAIAMLLVAVEVEFADGGLARTVIGETLSPGQQSRAIAVDRGRAIRRIIVVKRPGLREGESELQILAVPEKAKRIP